MIILTSSAIFPYMVVNCSVKWMHITVTLDHCIKMIPICVTPALGWWLTGYNLPLTISCVAILIERNHAPAFSLPDPPSQRWDTAFGGIMPKIVHGWYTTEWIQHLKMILFLLYNQVLPQNTHKNHKILMLGPVLIFIIIFFFLPQILSNSASAMGSIIWTWKRCPVSPNFDKYP